ncbi:MAG: iron ABC transporter permease [Bacteroidales bacterium]|nr:iron ABC transporter permease [Bacteroidales bacterium]
MKYGNFIIVLLIVALVLLMFVSCLIGVADIGIDEAWKALLSVFSGSKGSSQVSENTQYIIFNLRLPRTLLAVLSGAGLSVCGVAFQAIFRNPLSDPYVLGVSSGASLGAAIAIITGLNGFIWGISGLSFLTALASVMLIVGISSIGNRLHTTTLLLAGISLNFLIAAVVSLLMVLNHQSMDKIIFWTMGSLASATFENTGIVALFVVIGIGVTGLYAKDLNALLLGNQTAKTIGINVERTKRIILLVSTLMIAVIVSFTGVIGFVGLVVPHVVRLLVGADNRRIIPYSLLGGMLFMLSADVISRTVMPPSELPIGSITSLIGSPVFIYLLFNAKKRLNR